jgi:zinc finger SWIM domain-containing protein 3
MPKAAHEYACRRVGGPLNLGYTVRDQKNHLRTKRQRELGYGQAGSMLKYFHDKIIENPSFQHALQLDCEEHIANIFWADAKMVLDYAHFDDVVTFDTTFGTNKEYRPFGVFLGLNQFRETTIFGAALLFDETCDSFKWLFETFLATHNGRQPRTIYTDQDAAMGKAIEKVFTESYHGLCTFHIMQNAIKHLCPLKDEEKEEGKGEDEEKEPHILADFSECMYGYEDKAEFQEAFDNMRLKVHKQTWLDSIYKVKEKWAECYMRDVFSLGVRSTQLSDSFNNSLKNHLKSDFHIVRFLMHFERTLEEKRAKELQSEYESRKKLPRIKMQTPMLVLASEEYTPIMFEAFQGEYERSMAACTRVLDEDNKFGVSIGSLHGDLKFEEERIVIGDPLGKTASCSCEMFNRTGILCAHGIKVLDLMNIKVLPPHYILKRLTRGARNGSIQDRHGRKVVENPKLEAQLRIKTLSHKFHSLAYKVANSLECCLILENALDSVGTQVEDKLNETTNATNMPCNDQENIDPNVPNVQQTNEYLSAKLKKKEVQSKNLRRKKSWLDKLLKGRRKPTKVAASKKKGPKVCCNLFMMCCYYAFLNYLLKHLLQQQGKNDGVEPQVRVEKDDVNEGATREQGATREHQECNTIISYTQLLTAPLGGVYDGHMF